MKAQTVTFHTYVREMPDSFLGQNIKNPSRNVSWSSSVTSDAYHLQPLKLSHGCFLPYKFQFIIHYSVTQRCTKPTRQVSVATKVCTLSPIICGAPVWNVLNVIFLEPGIFMRFLNFFLKKKNLCTPALINRCQLPTVSLNKTTYRWELTPRLVRDLFFI